jgi:hypothetical protein
VDSRIHRDNRLLGLSSLTGLEIILKTWLEIGTISFY